MKGEWFLLFLFAVDLFSGRFVSITINFSRRDDSQEKLFESFSN